MTDTPALDPAAGFPEMPDALKVANRPAVGGTPKTLQMIKEAAMAAKATNSKLDQVRALREARAAEAEATAKANPAGRDPAALAARERIKADQKSKTAAKGPQRKPLTFVDGRAKAKHAHYDVRIDDTGPARQFILTATTAEGVARIGEFDQPTEARDAAADHHHGLALNGAPIYKPARNTDQKDGQMAAKAKSKAKAPKAKSKGKAKAAKAKPAKKAKGAAKAKANARKPVKGKTAARKPRAEGAPTKAATTIARLKAWTSSTELQKDLGWLPHTLRGFLSGLRTKQGMTIETDRRAEGTFYRIAK